ncbi:MAG: hypothetical protein F6K30_24790, partial [Cyanothece sp. SIO2G6]|nr:hypothetical protein [Cyanothece sp. SIO2G6]
MEGYLVSLIIFTAVFALFSLGLNLQWGFTGLLNFGQVAFMLVSAYIVVILTSEGYLKELPIALLDEFKWMQDTPAIAQSLQGLSTLLPSHLPMVVAVIVGAIAAALLGLILGFATLKLRTDYLAIVTIGTAEVLRSVALNEQWLTRGAFGIQRFPLPLANLEPNYLVRLLLILSFTAVVGMGYYTLWRWLHRTVKTVPLATLVRSSGAVALYGLIAVTALWGMGAIAKQLNRQELFSPWLAGAFPFVALGLIGFGLIGLAQRYR